MVSVSTTAFERIGERPPTPPKDQTDEIDDALNFLRDDYSVVASTGKILSEATSGVETPPRSSPPPSQYDSGSKAEKKVEFCDYTIKHDGATVLGMNGRKPTLRRLPSQKDLKPLRSILKTSLCQTPTPDEIDSTDLGYFSLGQLKSFSKMLDSVIKSLGSQTLSLRLDGYQALNGALKTYADLADEETLRAKLPQLVHYLSRDIQSTIDNPQTTNIITQALKLTIALLHIPGIVSGLSTEFQTMLLDTSLEVIGRDPVNKAIANHHMYLLATQKFSPRILTATKAEQIITRLSNVHDRVSGNSVIGARLVIYQRLVEQMPTFMLNKIRDWIPHIFHGVLSSNKEIQPRAAECGNFAGIALGKHGNASRAIVELFSSETAEGGDYGTYFTARLSDMFGDKQSSAMVPRIWGMIVLFFQSRKRPISNWQMFRPLLLIIQRCMNSSDMPTRYGATLAWNRLVFVLELDSSQPTDRITQNLVLPFSGALDRRGTDTASREVRQIALSGYCNLLYYALQPAQTFERLDAFWNIYAHEMLTRMMRTGGKDARFAGRILKALFLNGATAWNPNRANEQAPVVPEELPRIDPKWIRSRLDKLLQIFEPYFGISLWMQGHHQDISASPWADLMSAVAEAGRQEVRASTELKESLAHLMNFYSRLWESTSKWSQQTTHDLWISRFGDLVLASISGLGALHFAEDNIVCNQSHKVEPAPTPSNRASKHHLSLQTPLAYIWNLFSSSPAIVKAEDEYFLVARKMLQRVYYSQVSQKARLAILRGCIPETKITTEDQTRYEVASRLCDIVADEMAELLLANDEAVQGQQGLGVLAHQATSLLCTHALLKSRSQQPSAIHGKLFSTIANRLREGAGDAGVCLGLIEPIAGWVQEHRNDLPKSSVIEISALLLTQSTWPRSRQHLEDARKTLHGNHLDLSRKQAAFEPFDHLLNLTNAACDMLEKNMAESPTLVTALVCGLRNLITNCPPSLMAVTLRKLQPGIVTLIEDTAHVFGTATGFASSVSLWSLERRR